MLERSDNNPKDVVFIKLIKNHVKVRGCVFIIVIFDLLKKRSVEYVGRTSLCKKLHAVSP